MKAVGSATRTRRYDAATYALTNEHAGLGAG
jgi:hypothetical protein